MRAMCSHYQAVRDNERLRRHFGVDLPADPGRHDLWPGYQGVFIRRHPHAGVHDEAVNPNEALSGLFGLVPHWSADTRITRFTYNARSETVASKPSFRDAWRRGQHCIVPADSIFEPDWRSGKAVPACIARADGQPMGIAGLWSSWRSPGGQVIYSYTMLTINANHHPLMRQFHKQQDEKRMVVILPTDAYDDWLHAKPSESMAFMQAFPADQLAVSTEPASPTLL